MRISCAQHLTMSELQYAILFPAFDENAKWNSLSQGHDDEQNTTIFQKALLVANQVWMGLSERNCTQKQTLKARLSDARSNSWGTGRQAFQKADLNCIKPNNLNVRDRMWRLSRNWQNQWNVNIITASEPPVVLNFDPGHPNQWGRLPCRTVALSSFDLVSSADESCFICHMPWQQRIQYHRHRSHLKQVFHRKHTRKHCKRENKISCMLPGEMSTVWVSSGRERSTHDQHTLRVPPPLADWCFCKHTQAHPSIIDVSPLSLHKVKISQKHLAGKQTGNPLRWSRVARTLRSLTQETRRKMSWINVALTSQGRCHDHKVRPTFRFVMWLWGMWVVWFEHA